MGLYNVIEPCAAGDVHYVRPTAEFQPVWVDDDVAAPLVAEGHLSAYEPAVDGDTGTSLDGVLTAEDDGKLEEATTARRKAPRRSESDGG